MAGGLCLAVVLCCPPLSPYFCFALEPPPYFQLDSCLCKINSQLLLVPPKKEILPLANFLSLIPMFLEEARHARPPIQDSNGAQHRALATISYYCSAALNRLGFTGTDLFRLSGY